MTDSYLDNGCRASDGEVGVDIFEAFSGACSPGFRIEGVVVVVVVVLEDGSLLGGIVKESTTCCSCLEAWNAHAGGDG